MGGISGRAILQSLAASALCLSLLAGSAQAAVEFSFVETGGNVVGTLSGSLNLSGAIFMGLDTDLPEYINPTRGEVVTGPLCCGFLDSYAISGPSSFGGGTSTLASSSTGSEFEIVSTFWVGVPQGFASGGTLSGTLTFLGADFAGLGIVPGEYVYSLPNDTITLRFVPAVIPLPAALPLLLGGIGLLGSLRLRRQRASALLS